MAIKFEIEGLYQEGKKKHTKYFVFAKCLEMDKNFEVTDQSTLGNVEISNFLAKPRATDPAGNPRFDVFLFKIRYKKDCAGLEKGQIVELVNHA